MGEYLRKIGHFLNNLDARAATSLGVSLVLILFVIFMFSFGQEWRTEGGENALGEILAQYANSPWSIFGVVSVYVVLAFTAFPQFVLIAATIIAFGPVTGVFYSWAATMVSATVTFGLGHFLGARWVEQFGGDRVQRTTRFIGRHGIIASALVRVVPSAPFIVVNSAAGAAHISLWKYWVGTGIGIIPKMVLVASLSAFALNTDDNGGGFAGINGFFTNREPKDIAIIIVIIVAWLIFLFFMRRTYLYLRRKDEGR